MWTFFTQEEKMHPLHPLHVIRCPNIMNSHLSDLWLWSDGGHLFILYDIRETWGDGSCSQTNIMSILVSTASLYLMYCSINVLHFVLHKEKFLLSLTCHSYIIIACISNFRCFVFGLSFRSRSWLSDIRNKCIEHVLNVFVFPEIKIRWER